MVGIGAGSGGTSTCTAPTGTTTASCTGGYAKPSWQTGTGVPADGKRDLPDLSLYSSNWVAGGIDGSAILFCYATSGSNSCDYTDPSEIVFQEIGGTSAASPYMAGVMAMILQKTKTTKQGLANPTFYKLAATESLAACKSSTVKNGNSCIFYDITTGPIAQACITGSPDCTTNTSGDPIGIQDHYSAATGYDRATGLGSVNIANLVERLDRRLADADGQRVADQPDLPIHRRRVDIGGASGHIEEHRKRGGQHHRGELDRLSGRRLRADQDLRYLAGGGCELHGERHLQAGLDRDQGGNLELCRQCRIGANRVVDRNRIHIRRVGGGDVERHLARLREPGAEHHVGGQDGHRHQQRLGHLELLLDQPHRWSGG